MAVDAMNIDRIFKLLIFQAAIKNFPLNQLIT